MELASLVSEGGIDVYEERLLKLLKSKWLKGEHATLTSDSGNQQGEACINHKSLVLSTELLNGMLLHTVQLSERKLQHLSRKRAEGANYKTIHGFFFYTAWTK